MASTPIQRTGHRYRDTDTGKTLDVWFPASGTAKKRSCLAEKVGLVAGDFVDVAIESLDAPPVSTEDAYLRLHLLSERSVKPNDINLDGIFALLPNIAWTSAGPVLPARVDDLRERVAADYHHLTVTSVDIQGSHLPPLAACPPPAVTSTPTDPLADSPLWRYRRLVELAVTGGRRAVGEFTRAETPGSRSRRASVSAARNASRNGNGSSGSGSGSLNESGNLAGPAFTPLRVAGFHTAADLAGQLALEADRRDRDDFGRLTDPDPEPYARTWLAAAVHLAAVERALVLASWRTAPERASNPEPAPKPEPQPEPKPQPELKRRPEPEPAVLKG